MPEDVAQPPPESQIWLENPHAKAPGNEEVLVPGGLYADCSVVKLDLRVPASVSADIKSQEEYDDSEQFKLGLGNEALGRAVWEALENGVKIWEEVEKRTKLF